MIHFFSSVIQSVDTWAYYVPSILVLGIQECQDTQGACFPKIDIWDRQTHTQINGQTISDHHLCSEENKMGWWHSKWLDPVAEEWSDKAGNIWACTWMLCMCCPHSREDHSSPLKRVEDSLVEKKRCTNMKDTPYITYLTISCLMQEVGGDVGGAEGAEVGLCRTWHRLGWGAHISS